MIMMMKKTLTIPHQLRAFINPRFRLKPNFILSSSLLESFKFITTSCNPPFSLKTPLHSNSSFSKCHHHRSPSKFQTFRNLDHALKLFDEMSQRRPLPSVVKFNHLLNAVTKMKRFSSTLDLFKQMCAVGVPVNEYSISIAIRCCCGLFRTKDAFALLASCFRRGVIPNVVTFNTLLDGLIREDRIIEAEILFKKLTKQKLCEPTEVTYSTMIKGLCKFGANDLAIGLLRLMDERGCKPSVVTYNTIFDSLCKDKMLDDAFKLFKEMVFEKGILPDVITYTSLIYGLCLLGRWDEVFKMLEEMEDVRIPPSLRTYSILVDALCKEGKVGEAEAVIDIMVERGVVPDIVTYSSLIDGYCLRGEMTKARTLFDSLTSRGLVPSVFTYNIMINGYCKNFNIEEAMHMFLEMKRKGLKLNIVTYNTMLQGFFMVGRCGDAHKLFEEMQAQGIGFDEMTLIAILTSAANLSAYEQGKLIHAHALKFGLISATSLADSLVNMYARCGSIDDATRAFNEVPEKNIVSWSTMIGAFAQHGYGKEALSLFDDMLKDGIVPDNITLSNVLCACNHAGLVTQAKQYFESMEDVFGITLSLEHYTCMIDILARDGKLHEAMDLVNSMPFEADGSVWGAILGAAGIHKNVEIGQTAARKLMLLDPVRSGTHVSLANIYASAGLWENAAGVRRLMKDSKVKSQSGMSWLEVKRNK